MPKPRMQRAEQTLDGEPRRDRARTRRARRPGTLRDAAGAGRACRRPGAPRRAAGHAVPSPDAEPARVALDRAIRAADAIADALIAHGQEVAEAAALRDRLRPWRLNVRGRSRGLRRRSRRGEGKGRLCWPWHGRPAATPTTFRPCAPSCGPGEAAVVCLLAREAAAAELADVETATDRLPGPTPGCGAGRADAGPDRARHACWPRPTAGSRPTAIWPPIARR